LQNNTVTAKLHSPYVSIASQGSSSVGGSQMWSDHKIVRRCGCGPVAAYDLLLYLGRKHGSIFAFPASRQEYCRELEKLQRRYFPLIYPKGVNGILLTLGLNRMFHDRRLPYYAVWAVSGEKLFDRMADMLQNDIPVILSVGPNFPLFWQKNKLMFYRLSSDGCYLPGADVKSHYVTALEMTDEWVKIASWGRCYYIRISEYKNYVNRNSNFVISNLVLIKEKGTD
jgi:hypothetical protein